MANIEHHGRSREQKLIDIMFEIVVRFGSNALGSSREAKAAWLSSKLKDSGFETKPMGMSWGVLVDDVRSVGHD